MPLPTVFIVIKQFPVDTTPGGVSTDQLVLGAPVTLNNNNDTDVLTWLWQFVDKPENSSATLATPTQAISGFTPDVVGTYLIKLTVNGVHFAMVGAAVLTSGLHFRIPAAMEEEEFSSTRGWGQAVNHAFQVLDDGYVAITDLLPPLPGVQFAALIENPVGDTTWEKLSGDKILDKYAIASFQTTGATAVEVGSSVLEPAFTASYNRAATGASINDGTNTDIITLPATSFAYNGTSLPSRNYTKTVVNDQQLFTLTATDGYGVPTSVATIQWQPKVFYGSQAHVSVFELELPNGDFEAVSSAPWQLTPIDPDGYASIATAGVNYIFNGDFEVGSLSGWTIANGLDVTGTGSGTSTGVAVATTIDKHSGTYSMLLGSTTSAAFAGDVSASQNIDIPLQGTTTLSFWFKTSAPDGIGFDWFQAHIRNAAGTTVLQDLFAFPITVGDSLAAHRATPTGGSTTPPLGEIGPVFYNSGNTPAVFSSWVNVVADLTPYAGQTVKLFFLAEDDAATPAPTRLFIDDIQLKNTYPHSGTKFGQVYTAKPTSGGLVYQLLTLPDLPTTATLDGYYRFYGSGVAGTGDSQAILIMDSTLSTVLDTIVQADSYGPPGAWQHFTYDLSAFVGTQIAIVARVQSTAALRDVRVIEIDDFSISTSFTADLSSQLQPSKVSAGITVTVDNNEFLTWIGPTSYNATADNFIDAETGIPIGMIKTASAVDITNQYGVTIAYDIWESEYDSFGQLTFVVRNNNE